MLRRVLAGLCVGFMCIFAASCGQTYKVVSIDVTPANGYSLDNASPTGQLTVTATYSNTKTSDVTLSSSYSIAQSGNPISGAAPAGAVSANNSGLVTASTTLLACTFDATTSTPYPYIAQVSYTNNGVTVHATAPINVSTAPGCTQAAQN